MLDKIRKRIANMGTIKTLCEDAEKHALREDIGKPGAEHFLLAAIDLPDGTAKLAFANLGADASTFREAIQRQYEDALGRIGLDPQALARPSPENATGERHGVYSAAASGQEVMQALAADRTRHEPLLGAHVIIAVVEIEHGVAARAFRAMGIDRAALKRAAEDVIEASSGVEQRSA